MHNLNEELYEKRKKQIQPWLEIENEYVNEEQKLIKALLQKKANAIISENAYIASDANIFTSKFYLGDNSWVASGAIIRGDVSIGSHCSINPNAHIAGKVEIGSGCRIAGLVSIYGFNHGHSRTDVFIKDQPSTSKGVQLGQDVWVGANAVILDGVVIGDHSIVAAGAVVTKSFPDYSIIAGSPAKKLKDRREYPLAKFNLVDKGTGIKYHFDMKFNSYVSCSGNFLLRGWILYPNLESLIVKSNDCSSSLTINKIRPDVVNTFFKEEEDTSSYVKCGFEHFLDVRKIYSLHIKSTDSLINFADIVMEGLLHEEER